MTVTSNAETKVYHGGAATGETLADLKKGTFVEIKHPKDIGEAGDEAEIIRFEDMAAGRILKAKGAVDAGDFELIVGEDPKDPGQIAMRTAMTTKAPQIIKIVTTDGLSLYFAGPVVSTRRSFDGMNNVRMMTFRVAITTRVFEEAA